MCWPPPASKWYGLGGKVTPNGPTVGPSSSSIVVENYCNYLCHLGTKETSNVGACSRRLWLTRVSPHCSVSLTQVFLHVNFRFFLACVSLMMVKLYNVSRGGEYY